MNYFARALLVTLLMSLSTPAWAQAPKDVFNMDHLELGGGFLYQTGNFGTAGFNATGGIRFNPYVTLTAEADFMWDRSRVANFDVSSVNAFSIKTNLQQYFGGARVNLRKWVKQKELEKRKLIPFAEIQLGVAHIEQSVTNATGVVDSSASDSSFTWVLGGGLDYALNAHWSARGNIDLVRTHFGDAGQSHARVGVGLVFAF